MAFVAYHQFQFEISILRCLMKNILLHVNVLPPTFLCTFTFHFWYHYYSNRITSLIPYKWLRWHQVQIQSTLSSAIATWPVLVAVLVVAQEATLASLAACWSQTCFFFIWGWEKYPNCLWYIYIHVFKYLCNIIYIQVPCMYFSLLFIH